MGGGGALRFAAGGLGGRGGQKAADDLHGIGDVGSGWLGEVEDAPEPQGIADGKGGEGIAGRDAIVGDAGEEFAIEIAEWVEEAGIGGDGGEEGGAEVLEAGLFGGGEFGEGIDAGEGEGAWRTGFEGEGGIDAGAEEGDHPLDHGMEEVVLGVEVVEETALGDAGLGGDGFEGEGVGAATDDDDFSGVEETVAGGGDDVVHGGMGVDRPDGTVNRLGWESCGGRGSV